MEQLKEYLPVIAILFTFTGLIFQFWHVKKEIAKDRLVLEGRIIKLETKTDLFWKAIEGNIVHLLKSYPTNLQKDVLLDKMIHGDIILDEAYCLRTILKEEMKDRKELTVAYSLALGRLAVVIYELTEKKNVIHNC